MFALGRFRLKTLAKQPLLSLWRDHDFESSACKFTIYAEFPGSWGWYMINDTYNSFFMRSVPMYANVASPIN